MSRLLRSGDSGGGLPPHARRSANTIARIGRLATVKKKKKAQKAKRRAIEKARRKHKSKRG